MGRQAVAPTLPLGESRRWNFAEMQKLKKNVISESVDEPHKPTEIFVMLPLDIIAVGELFEGPGHRRIHPLSLQPRMQLPWAPMDAQLYTCRPPVCYWPVHQRKIRLPRSMLNMCR